MERHLLTCRPNRFHNLFFDGDWHTRLATALLLAKNATASEELFAAIEVLESQLTKNDECIHTVTLIQEVPIGVESKFLMKCIVRCIDVQPANLCQNSDGHIELTITARGNPSSVHGMAALILSRGVSQAQAIIAASQIDI